MPSIGAVSRLDDHQPRAGRDQAWQIAVEGGEVSPPRPASLAEGTQVEVRDLFFATPARLKFLKTARTESDFAREAIERLAMAHPHIDFTWQEDDKRPVRFAAERRLAVRMRRLCAGALRDVLGEDFMDNAAPILMRTREGSQLSGYAGLPTLA